MSPLKTRDNTRDVNVIHGMNAPALTTRANIRGISAVHGGNARDLTKNRNQHKGHLCHSWNEGHAIDEMNALSQQEPTAS